MRPLPSTAGDEKHDKRELHRGTRPQSDMHPQCTEVEETSSTSSSETLVQKSPTWPSPTQGSRYEQMAPDVYVKPPKCNPATRQKNRKGCPESKDRSYQSEGVRKDSDDSAMDVDSVHIKQEEDYDEMVMVCFELSNLIISCARFLTFDFSDRATKQPNRLMTLWCCAERLPISKPTITLK